MERSMRLYRTLDTAEVVSSGYVELAKAELGSQGEPEAPVSETKDVDATSRDKTNFKK